MKPIVLAKGAYKAPSGNFVSVRQYLLVREDGKKFLLLKLNNDRDETVTGVGLKIAQFDGRGNPLGVITAGYRVEGKPRAAFVLDEKIPMDDACADFSVAVETAAYGRYAYTDRGGEPVVSYRKSEYAPRPVRPVKRSVLARTLRLPAFAIVVSLITLAAVIAGTWFQLGEFKASADGFLRGGVEYAFENGDKSEGSRVYAVGYKGLSRSVVIPGEIGGHPVAYIESAAFRGNDFIESVTVEGNFDIPARAFSDCVNLKTVALKGAGAVGREAFSGCRRLKSFAASNLSSVGEKAFYRCNAVSVTLTGDVRLAIGREAFAACPEIGSFTVTQPIDYDFNDVFFDGDTGIGNLTLSGFQTAGGGSRTLSTLFGLSAGSRSMPRVEVLSIGELDALPDRFCYGFEIKAFSAGALGSDEAGTQAFYGCPLERLSLPVPLKRVGAGAFYKNKLAAFDGRALEYVGEDAFSGCEKLESPGLEENAALSYIGPGAFSGCASLKSVSLPKDLERIPDRAFSDCAALVQVSVRQGSKLVSVGNKAFSGCVSLPNLPLPSGVLSIGAEAFSGCEALLSAGLTNRLTELGERAFQDCVSLRSVKVPDSVTKIGKGAFRGCKNIESVSLPFIGGSESEYRYLSYLFGDAPNRAESVPAALASVTLTKSAEIPEAAFFGCVNLREVVFLSALERIGGRAFYNCRRLGSVELPATVTAVGGDAFTGCYKLFEVYNYSALPVIRGSEETGRAGYYALKVYTSADEPPIARAEAGGCAFARADDGTWFLIDCEKAGGQVVPPASFAYEGTRVRGYEVVRYMAAYNDAIESVVLPQGVKKVGECAFLGSSVKSAVLPASVVSIGAGTFADTELAALTVPYVGGSAAENRTLSYLFSDAVPKTLANVTVTGGTDLADYAFYNCVGLESVSLPASVVIVGRSAFEGCTSLQAAPLSAVKAIGAQAFKGCVSLTSAELSAARTIGDRAFAGCHGLERLSADANAIGDWAFTNCPSLRSAVIGAVASIGEGAFAGCSSLAELRTDGRPLSVGSEAFSGCSSLKNLPDGMTAIGNRAFSGCESLVSAPLPDGLVTIGSYAFSNCGRLASAAVPLSVNAVGAGAFADCVSLVSLEIPFVGGSRAENRFLAYLFGGQSYFDSHLVPTSLKNVTVTGDAVPDYAFFQLNGLGSAAIPNVRTIGTQAFYNSGIESIYIPDSAETIGTNAFGVCYNLKSVRFGPFSRLTAVADGTFFSCGGLETLVLPSGVTAVGTEAFAFCEKLGRIELPAGLNSFGPNAFFGCYRLYEVCYLGSLSLPLGGDGYGGVAKYAVSVHGAAGEVRAKRAEINGVEYVYGDVWAAIGYTGTAETLKLDRFVYAGRVIDSFSVRQRAFAGWESLKAVTIGGAVTSMDENAFSDCHALESADLAGSSLTSIPPYAFASCYNLKTLTLPYRLTRIGEGAFRQCGALTAAPLPDSLEHIGAYAFHGCSNLRSVRLPAPLGTIEWGAFEECVSLFEVYNLSRLTVRAGGEEYGGVARYAIRVNASDSVPPIVYAEAGTFRFLRLDTVWYLYESEPIGTAQTVELPMSVSFEGENVGAYVVRRGALRIDGTEALIVPAGVSFAYGAAEYVGFIRNVYYLGTSNEWAYAMSGNWDKALRNAALWLYAPCVHRSGQWTFDENGRPTTQITALEWTLTKAATCRDTGERVGRCPRCDYTETETLPLVPHAVADGVCALCKAETAAVTAANFETLGCFQNDAVYPFKFDADGALRSNVPAGYTAALVVTGVKNARITFEIAVESAGMNDSFAVYLSGKELARVNGLSAPVTLTVDLFEGQDLKFEYGGWSGAREAAVISGLTILL